MSPASPPLVASGSGWVSGPGGCPAPLPAPGVLPVEQRVEVIDRRLERRAALVARPRNVDRDLRLDRPRRGPPSTSTRSASCTASSMLCVTMQMLCPASSRSPQTDMSSLRRFSPVSTSSAENGSSMSSRSGRCTNARAKPTRCAMPPESSPRVGGLEAIQPDRVDRRECACGTLCRAAHPLPAARARRFRGP